MNERQLEDYRRFCQALGAAISSWQPIEAQLCIICLAAVEAQNFPAFQALFYKMGGLDVRLNVVTDVFDRTPISGDLKAAWKRTRAAIGSHAGIRNRAVHGLTFWNFTDRVHEIHRHTSDPKFTVESSHPLTLSDLDRFAANSQRLNEAVKMVSHNVKMQVAAARDGEPMPPLQGVAAMEDLPAW